MMLVPSALISDYKNQKEVFANFAKIFHKSPLERHKINLQIGEKSS
jgi:hypothetical protein